MAGQHRAAMALVVAGQHRAKASREATVGVLQEFLEQFMAARKTRDLEDLCKDLVAIAFPCLAPFDLFALHIVVCSMCEPPCLGHLARIMCIVVCSMCEPPCVNHLACTCRTPLQTAGDGGGDNLEVCAEGEAHGRVPRLVRAGDEEGACKCMHVLKCLILPPMSQVLHMCLHSCYGVHIV